jgi:hypothetical protein
MVIFKIEGAQQTDISNPKNIEKEIVNSHTEYIYLMTPTYCLDPGKKGTYLSV